MHHAKKVITGIILLLSVFLNGYAISENKSGGVKMTDWSLGRIDFSIPSQFELRGRSQSIYHVDVTTNLLNGKTSADVWNEKLKKIKAIHVNATKNNEQITIEEIEPGFPVVAYRENASSQLFITVEGQKTVGNSLLSLKYQGRAGKEKDIMNLLSITAEGYQVGVSHGFNVGAGSVTSKPSVNEYARALFKQVNSVELSVTVKTAGKQLEQQPLEDIDHEIKGLARDDMTLKVLKNEEREVAGFLGYEGHITIEGKDESPQFRFTWFTPGVTADSFRPEILIKVHGPVEKIEEFKPIWEKLLKSLRMRPATN